MEECDFKADEVRTAILTNKHNHITTTYYLLLKKFIRQGGNSIADLSSPEFMRYMIMMNKMNHNMVKVSKPKQIKRLKSSDEDFLTENLLDESLNSSKFSVIKPEEYYIENHTQGNHIQGGISQGNNNMQGNIVFNQNNIIIGKPKLQAIQVLSDFNPNDNFKIINKNAALKILKKLNKNKVNSIEELTTNATKDFTVLNTQMNYPPPNQTEILNSPQHGYDSLQTCQNDKKTKDNKEDINQNLFIKKIIKKIRDNTPKKERKVNEKGIEKIKEYNDKENKVDKDNKDNKADKDNKENKENKESIGDKKIAAKKNAKYTVKNFINTSMSYCTNDIRNATYDGTEDVNKKPIQPKKLKVRKNKMIISHSSPNLIDEDKINQIFFENLQLDYSRIEDKINLSKFIPSNNTKENIKHHDEKVDFVIKETKIYNKNKYKKAEKINISAHPKEHTIKLSPINFVPSIVKNEKIEKNEKKSEKMEKYHTNHTHVNNLSIAGQESQETYSNDTLSNFTGTTASNFKTTFDQNKLNK